MGKFALVILARTIQHVTSRLTWLLQLIYDQCLIFHSLIIPPESHDMLHFKHVKGIFHEHGGLESALDNYDHPLHVFAFVSKKNILQGVWLSWMALMMLYCPLEVSISLQIATAWSSQSFSFSFLFWRTLNTGGVITAAFRLMIVTALGTKYYLSCMKGMI